MAPGLLLYNQSTLNDDDFVAHFVARHDVLEALLRRLRISVQEAGAGHQILIGSRGMGKSSLLRRLAIAINRDPDLADCYVPLTFREEQYNVLSLGDFWRNCGEALAEWAEATDRAALANRLDAALASDAWTGNEKPGESFTNELRQLGRRAVLLVDNIDLILTSLSDNDQWVLRRHLQARQGPVMIGAATQPLQQSADRNAAFYEFFQPHHLEPLGAHETEQCMRALAMRRGEHGAAVIRVLDNQPERLKTLHTLTGGNPRVLTLLYRLLETSESDAAMADLDILLDQVTPYYKARIEEYQTPQQRAVIDAIALHWDPITTSALSRTTNIPATTLSPLLIKLRKDGLIENTEVSGPYAGHQIAERFLNIWYLMRHGTRRTKHKMRWLVRFLTIFYSSSELADIARRVKSPAALHTCHPDYAFAVNEAMMLRMSGEGYAGQLPVFKPDDSFAKLEEQIPLGPKEGAGHNQHLNDDSQMHDIRTALTLLEKAINLGQIDDHAAAITAYDDALNHLDSLPETEFRAVVAIALVLKGEALYSIGNYTAAIAAYDAVLSRFDGGTEAVLREAVAKALFSKGISLEQKGNHAAAIVAYDGVLTRFDSAPEMGLRKTVAKALFSKGISLTQMGDHVAAIATCDAILSRFDGDTETDLREAVAKALIFKGITLAQMSDHAAAIAACNAVLSRFDGDTETDLREAVAKALIFKGITLDQMGDHAAAIAACDAILNRFDGAPETGLREAVVKALIFKGVSLTQMGDHAAAIAACDAVLSRFDGAPETDLREAVAKALIFKGVSLARMSDHAAGIAAYNAVLTRFNDDLETGLREAVAEALIFKGVSLAQMGDHAAAITSYSAALNHFDSDPEIALNQDITGLRIRLATLLLDFQDELVRAEKLYQASATANPLLANGNLAWLYLLDDRITDARKVRSSLDDLPPYGRSLLDAAMELAQDNFGLAANHLATVFTDGLDTGGMDFNDDMRRLIRLAEKKGHGERLIAWFEETNIAERVAPIYVALKAYVRGEKVLLDVNPEVRSPAQIIYNRLDAPRRHKRKAVETEKSARQPRGRRR